jgi:hypothetical protein
MNGKILAILLAVLFAIFLPSLSTAQAPHDYQCELDNLQRRVVIFYETGVTVPCEVHYFKDTEAPGETQVLWRALNEAGYCERMADNFIGKLRDMGWSCEQGGGAETATAVAEPAAAEEPEAESAEGDDTEVLIPAEENEPGEE